MAVIYTLPILNNFKTKDLNADIKYENRIINDPSLSYAYINRDYMPLNAIVLQNTYLKDRGNTTYVLDGSAKIIDEQRYAYGL